MGDWKANPVIPTKGLAFKQVFFFILNQINKKQFRIRSGMSADQREEKSAWMRTSANVAAWKECTGGARLEGESCHPDFKTCFIASFFILNHFKKNQARIRSGMISPPCLNAKLFYFIKNFIHRSVHNFRLRYTLCEHSSV